jgi:hypothetical protein
MSSAAAPAARHVHLHSSTVEFDAAMTRKFPTDTERRSLLAHWQGEFWRDQTRCIREVHYQRDRGSSSGSESFQLLDSVN